MSQQTVINMISQAMLPHLDNAQMRQLSFVLDRVLAEYNLQPRNSEAEVTLGPSSLELMKAFLSAKHLEGCSENTLRYYRSVLSRMLSTTSKHVTHMRTEDLRQYLSNYELRSRCSKANIDNIRRILSSFFSWLEDE